LIDSQIFFIFVPDFSAIIIYKLYT